MTAGLPLSGIRILDLTHVWAGPLAVRYLSDLGAEVVRVEAPASRGPKEFPDTPFGGWLGGEDGGEPWNRNAIFVKLMRNRKSLCMDLKTQAGRATFLDLVAEADVVMENFSARAMSSLGLEYETLKAANPRIIYVTMPGFGHDGPLRERVAFGPTVEAMSGFSEMMGYSPDEPRNTAMALMDPITAMNAVAGVVTALLERQADNHSKRVEMSLHESGVSYNGPWLIDTQLGNQIKSLGNGHPQMVPHGIYRCRGDDDWLALACTEQAHWQALAVLLGLDPAWRLDDRQARREQIDLHLTEFIGGMSKEVAAEKLQTAGIAAGPVNNAPEMIGDAQVQARGFFVPFEQFDTPMPGTPIKMKEIDPEQWRPCPALGADNEDVLKEWLNMDDSSIAQLYQSRTLSDEPPE